MTRVDGWDLVVADMVGTTIQDLGLISGAIDAALGGVAPGIEPDAHEISRLRGASKLELFESIVPGNADLAQEMFNSALRDLIAEDFVVAQPGAEGALATLRESGVATCLTTGLERHIAEAIVTRLGWDDLVGSVLTATDVERGRPSPDLVLAAALGAQVSAMNRVVVCGDTTNDIQCGANAGAGLLVGVLTGAHTAQQLESIPGAVVIESIADLPGLLHTR